MSDHSPHVTILYHYFHPDDVVSARHFSDLAVGLKARGWQVTAVPCNRSCRDDNLQYPRASQWQNIAIERIWRPSWRQSSAKGRILNAAWMLAAWAGRGAFGRRHCHEVMIVGTDPILGVLAALPWRLFRRHCIIAHWCFDLYPEAAIAEGMISPNSWIVAILKRILAAAYRHCNLLADLGDCMAERLRNYRSPAHALTLPPWALVEPELPELPDIPTRHQLFGNARLGLLYSGSFGRAHEYREFLLLARLLRGESIHFCFAGRGNRAEELRAAIEPDDTNISFAGFAPENELAKRLGACDLHLVSLREDWTGTVVPSKFFGALAAGRGVIFAGSETSAIARWIRQYQVGWVLTSENVREVADGLRRLESSNQESSELSRRCHEVYTRHFSRELILDRWDQELRRLLERKM